MSFSKLTSKGQITIPSEIRSLLKLKAGDKVEFRVEKDGTQVYFIPSKNLTENVFGILSGKGKSLSTEEMDMAIQKRMKEKNK